VRAGDVLLLEELSDVSVLQVRDEIPNALLSAFPEEMRCHEIIK
jgi:hypothetical protein